MLELLKFTLDNPANFFGTICLMLLTYALYGSGSIALVKAFYEQKSAAKIRELQEAARIEKLGKE